MPTIKKAPSAREFTEAWTREFSSAVRSAAGSNGRLTLAEARALAQRPDPSHVYADTALGFLEQSGQRSVDVDKLIGIERAQVKDAAEHAAGANGVISLVEARRLPQDLREDFQVLRGASVTPPPSEDTRKQAIRDEVLRAIDDGSAVKLARAPYGIRGKRPVVMDIQHPASSTYGAAFVVHDQVYFQRASQTPSPLVGWWRIGHAP